MAATTEDRAYSGLPNKTVSAADGIDYAYRDTGGGASGTLPANTEPRTSFGRVAFEWQTLSRTGACDQAICRGTPAQSDSCLRTRFRVSSARGAQK